MWATDGGVITKSGGSANYDLPVSVNSVLLGHGPAYLCTIVAAFTAEAVVVTETSGL